MLKKLVFTGFFFFCVLIPTFIRFHIPFASFIPSERIAPILGQKHFLTIKSQEFILFSEEKMNRIPYDEYIDFSEKGYFVTYDKMGNNVSFFDKGKQIEQWKNQFKYPRINYPYLFLFSSDMSKAEVYHIPEGFDKPSAVILAEDMITSWNASRDGEYFITGDLSGKVYIYSHAEKKIKDFQLNKSRINYVKGVTVNSNGEYCALGGLAPELLYIANYNNKKQTIYSIPATGRTNRAIYNFSHYLVIEKDFGVFIVNKENKKIKEHNLNFKLYDAKEINYRGENFLILLMREGLTTRVEIFSENNYQYSLWIEDPSLPKIEHRHKKVLIIWENGAIEI